MAWFKLFFPNEMVSLENFNWWWWERNLPPLFHVVLKVSTSSQTALNVPYPSLCHHFSQFVLSRHLAPSVCVVSSPPLFFSPDGTSSSSPDERICYHLICEQWVSSAHKRTQSRKERPEERLAQGREDRNQGILLRFPDFFPFWTIEIIKYSWHTET